MDEDVPVEVARCLKQMGHEVFLVTEQLGVRTDDVDIWHHAIETDCILITCNRQDFLALAGDAPETGVIILNRRRSRQAECRQVLGLVEAAGESGLKRNVNFA